MVPTSLSSYISTYGDPVDQVFHWQGSQTLIVSMIKLLEDTKNMERDVQLGDVRVILLIEDSARYYSMFLPIVYKEIVQQMWRLMSDAINPQHRHLTLRCRPKIVLARTFDEAIETYQHYGEHMLGVISDVGYPRGGTIRATRI